MTLDKLTYDEMREVLRHNSEFSAMIRDHALELIEWEIAQELDQFFFARVRDDRLRIIDARFTDEGVSLSCDLSNVTPFFESFEYYDGITQGFPRIRPHMSRILDACAIYDDVCAGLRKMSADRFAHLEGFLGGWLRVALEELEIYFNLDYAMTDADDLEYQTETATEYFGGLEAFELLPNLDVVETWELFGSSQSKRYVA